MNEKELRESVKCFICNRKIGEAKSPCFWRITIKRYMVNAGAMQRQAGMELMMGDVALAQAMGPDEDMAVDISDGGFTITICDNCGCKNMILASIAENHAESANEDIDSND